MALLTTTALASPLLYASDAPTVLHGRCQYPDGAVRYRHETALILCDTASISRSDSGATFGFSQSSWGAMAQFSGAMSGNRMTVSRVALRDDSAVAATGTCEIFHRGDGNISVISCLARAGSRSVAANFVPSRL